MWHLLADENFNGEIVRGILRRQPDLAVSRVQDLGLRGAADEDLLAYAEQNHLILVSHDFATLAELAYQRVGRGERMSGVFLLSDDLPVGIAIQELLLLTNCSAAEEWDGLVVYLPLSDVKKL